jgi:hypothetical protein
MGNEVFKYPDTNSTRANIEFLNRKFKNQKIAIIGLGGTGSYILDLVSKTPVKEIHIYDKDVFQLHNAFRAPGAVSESRLSGSAEIKKVDYYHEIYSNMHSSIIPHDKYVSSNNLSEFSIFDCVFISIDRNKSRSLITKGLINLSVPFIDSGMGVNMLDDSLIGVLRVTTGSGSKNDHLDTRIGSEEAGENEYATNIQIADLNCLNAVMAVTKWKKMIGFYQDLKKEHNSLYFLNTGKIINEDFEA